MTKKSIRINLRAFAIKESTSLTQTDQALLTFKEKLQRSSAAKERCLLLSKDDPNQEKDLIANFEEASNPENIFCTMLRIAPGEEAQHVTNDLLEKPSFAIDELENIYTQGDSSIPAIRKEHYYFSINSKYLVTNLRSGKTIRDLQTYLAWFMGNDLFELYPMTKAPDDLTLKEIRHITFSGSSLSYNEQQQGKQADTPLKTESISIPKLAMSKLLGMISDIKLLNQHDLEKYISAELVLKIKSPPANEMEHFQKTMGALLLPVADLDNVVIRPRKGKAITGKDLALERSSEIAVTESGQIVEQALRQEMSKFLNELDDA